MPDAPWRWRLAVAEALAWLALARLLVGTVALRRWRAMLGPVAPHSTPPENPPTAQARRLARAVERAAQRLPFEAKCLPRAIALHMMLRRRSIPSQMVIAALHGSKRGAIEDLHAWVESGNDIVMGKLDFPFLPVVRFGSA